MVELSAFIFVLNRTKEKSKIYLNTKMFLV